MLETPLKESADKGLLDDHGAIVTLGYALNPDGSMHQILIERLETTLAMAKANDGELLGIYRDALRTYGMWSYRSYPLESR